jgi:hypothetical protein
MKIKINENQLKRLINEIGGYDDQTSMGEHASQIQSTIFIQFNTLSEIIGSFLMNTKEKNLRKENYLAFCENISNKLTSDIDMINSYKDEIFVDTDFYLLVLNYLKALQKFQKQLRLIYNQGLGIGVEMNEDELISEILNIIDELTEKMEPLALMMVKVHGRFRNRLGFNNQ